ncbi:MFS transporter [Arthrobacter citreus]|uniref:MFS transporter n=1 Tax=Arthrobacter citreus TaxID=1670 RepID=UPI003D15DC51
MGDEVSLPGIWGPVALVGANLFVIFFAATWGPVMWVTLGEVFPNNIRSLALGLGAMVNWIFNFIVTLSFPWVSDNFGVWIMYAIFTIFSVISFWFVKTKLPEFSGRRWRTVKGWSVLGAQMPVHNVKREENGNFG